MATDTQRLAAFEAELTRLSVEVSRLAGIRIFAECYTARGEPRADEDLSCDDHAGMFAARLHVAVASALDAGGFR